MRKLYASPNGRFYVIADSFGWGYVVLDLMREEFSRYRSTLQEAIYACDEVYRGSL